MSRASGRYLSLALLLSVLAACAIGSRLYIPGELARPGGAPKVPAGPPRVAVLDFAYDTVEPGVVGRDFDNVRPIDWKGEPGKAMADLVAGVLAEKGVTAVRAASEGPSLENVPVRVTGHVNRFEVNARRKGVKIVNEATVSLSLTVSGGELSSPVSSTTTISNSKDDAFVTPEGAREVLFASANAAAEEAARRILAAVAVAPPSPGK